MALTADEEGGGPYNGVDRLRLNESGWGEMRGGKRLTTTLFDMG